MDALPARPVFSDTTSGAEEPQRPFRVSGLLSLIFGLISIGALASTNLLFLPAIAIVFAVIAFRPARDPNVIPAGRTLAVIGATLAIFFASWSLAQRTVQTRSMAAEGESFAKNWLAVLADGQQEFAFELTLPPSERQLKSMSLAKFYRSNPEALERFQAFADQESVKAVIAAGDSLDWERVEILGPERVGHSQKITLRFRDRSGQITRPIDVALIRTPPHPVAVEKDDAPDAPVQWHVYRIAFAER